jgi:hypothetical protein
MRSLIALILTVAAATPASAAPFPVSHNPPAGATVVNPEIDCNADPLNTTIGAAGIIIDDPNITIINPEIRECVHGIRVQKKAGVMPTGVRIIASSAYPGYAETNFTLNRSAIMWLAGNGEVGDVSAQADQVGGELEFVDNYRDFNGALTTSFRMHHTSATCVLPCPTFSGADSPGAHWGLKFIANRTLGAPFGATGVRFDHNFVQGFDDEGISFDPRSNTPSMRLAYAAGTITAKSAKRDRLTIPGIPTGESTVGMYVTVNEGAVRGRTLEIRSRSADAFRVADPSNHIPDIVIGTRVSIGGRYFDNLIDHNTIDLFHATAAKSGFNTAGQTFSRIVGNVFYDTPSFDYTSAFHLRTDHQCIMIRSAAGPGVPTFSFYNAVVGNTCTDAGDISAVVVSWGTYEVDSPTRIRDNTFTGSPLGEVHRYDGGGVAT